MKFILVTTAAVFAAGVGAYANKHPVNLRGATNAIPSTAASYESNRRLVSSFGEQEAMASSPITTGGQFLHRELAGEDDDSTILVCTNQYWYMRAVTDVSDCNINSNDRALNTFPLESNQTKDLEERVTHLELEYFPELSTSPSFTDVCISSRQIQVVSSASDCTGTDEHKVLYRPKHMEERIELLEAVVLGQVAACLGSETQIGSGDSVSCTTVDQELIYACYANDKGYMKETTKTRHCPARLSVLSAGVADVASFETRVAALEGGPEPLVLPTEGTLSVCTSTKWWIRAVEDSSNCNTAEGEILHSFTLESNEAKSLEQRVAELELQQNLDGTSSFVDVCIKETLVENEVGRIRVPSGAADCGNYELLRTIFLPLAMDKRIEELEDAVLGQAPQCLDNETQFGFGDSASCVSVDDEMTYVCHSNSDGYMKDRAIKTKHCPDKIDILSAGIADEASFEERVVALEG